MKRGRDELPCSESFHLQKQRKFAEGESSAAGASWELYAGSDKQKELPEEHLQSRESEESSSLLSHQDPQVRLRALACLHAHIGLLSCDAADTERLFQALRSRLPREDNVHVAQLIVRLLASLVISICKFGSCQKIDPDCNSNSCFRTSEKNEHSLCGQERERGSNSSSIDDSTREMGRVAVNLCPHCDDEDESSILLSCSQSALRKASLINPTTSLPTPEPAVQCVKMLLSYASVETESPILKLQILRSLYQIAKEASSVRYVIVREHPTELLASSNPFIRAHTLHVVALSLVTDSDSKSLLGKDDSVGLFVEYTHDSNVVVRKASLHSLILLCCNGYLLTEGCHQAAVILLEDMNENVRSLALQVVSLWVKQDPGEHTNSVFLQVCKMMTDMELSVRIEACRAFLTMTNVREDLLLQALSKQPLDLINKVKEPQASSMITISETDVDISKYEDGLNILDRLNMGAFVHGIEDEFFEVRVLTLNALAHFCCVSKRACAAIIEVMINLLNDDSNQVRLKAVHRLIHVAHRHGLQINDNDLQSVHGILEDIDGAIRDAGKTLLTVIQHSSVDGLKSTIKSLMKLMQRTQQEKDVWHALYKLGRAHSTYVQFLAKDMLKELKACLSGEAGLDAPECGCILILFIGASETNTEILSLVPSQILSLTQLLIQSKFQMSAVLEINPTDIQVKIPGRHFYADMASGISSECKKEFQDYLARTVRTSWNVKRMLISGMFGRSRQVLRGCRRDMRKLLNMLRDEDPLALTTYALHYVECVYLVWQGWVHFQQKESLAMASLPSLSELACRLDFVVKCMQHTYIGHTDEQKLALNELSIIPALWRTIAIASKNDYKQLLSAVETIKSTLGQSSPCTPFMEKIEKNLLEAVSNSVNVQKELCELGSLFWPQLLNINNIRERKAVLSIPENDLEHPAEFLPNMPFGIPISILTKNLDTARIWVRIRLDSLWTKFMFVDAEECMRANPLVTNLHIPSLSLYSKCTLEAKVYVECLGMAYEAVRGPRGFLLPLTPDKLIHLMPASSALG